MENNEILNIKDNIIYFGLDHLEIFGTFNHEKELFEKLDFDNSNYGELEDYSFTKNEVPKYKYKVIFTKDNYSLFAYYKGDKDSNSIIKSKDKIVVYSTAFKLLNYEKIEYFLNGYFTLNKCFRFDICIDINIDINIILKEFTVLKTGKEYKKSGEIETRYIGDSNKYRNKRQVIRVYNKILDIVEKHKHKLYKKYLVEDFVTRVELEIRSELAKNLPIQDIFDNEKLTCIFRNYLKKHTKIFDNENAKNISLYQKPLKKITAEQYQSTYYRNQRRKIFVGHAKSVYEMGYCPVRVLLGEGLIKDDTKKFLDVDIVDRIAEIETILKREEFYKRQKIQERRSSNYKKND